ncbi:lamin-B1-like [Papaver somniferum]|uniref:lamin-B1-like n=1 Tax=Papaver somniferum TaxID=3469 RepID=UPI000E6FF9DC|nr:lamin-B1-like [Papaver somniferum]
MSSGYQQEVIGAAIRQKQLAEVEYLHAQLQQEHNRARGLETQLAEAKENLDIEQSHVVNLHRRIVNKDDKIDRQEADGDLRAEILRYERFEYVPEEVDNLRASLSRVQGIAADKTLLADNLESQCERLRLQIRDLHVDRKWILQEKDATEKSNQELHEKLRRFNQVSQEFEWVQAQLPDLQIAHDRQKADWSDHKKYCPTNEFNEQRYNKLTAKISSLESEQGKVKSLEGEVARLKTRETQLLGKVATAEAASTQLTLDLAVEKDKFKTELVTKVKEGVKAVIENKRADVAAKKAGSGSAQPKE